MHSHHLQFLHLVMPGSDTFLYFHNCSINLNGRDLPWRDNVSPVLMIASLGHSLVAFVNGEYVGKHTQTNTSA